MPSLVMQEEEEEEEEERQKVPFLLSSISLDELALANKQPENWARVSNLHVSSQQMDSEQDICTFHGIERAKANLPPSPTSTRGSKLFSRGLLSKSRFKSSRDPDDGAVESSLLTSTSSRSVTAQQRDIKSSGSGSFLWTRFLMNFSSGRMTLLSSTPLPNCSFEESMSLRGVPSVDVESGTTITKKQISRSLSVPVQRAGSLKRLGSSGGYILVRSVSRQFMAYESVDSKEKNGEATEVEVGEEIPEEEAVCRICMDVLNEGGETLKMECSCKGELALAHTDCAMKWFGIRGNRTCDVCGMEVENLPVTLIRLVSQDTDDQYQTQGDQDGSEVANQIWHSTPFLVIVSMLAYFGFLELLLVRNLGSSALAIALPFACVLGIFSSIIASTVVRKRIVWPYAALQFSLVIIFSHLFYEVIQMEPVVAIWLATLSGIVIAMVISALLFEFEKWRNRVE